jgi:DNA-binding NtrC family response regulator
LLAGTNVDLDHAVNAGRFRRDLLYRINIAQVTLPPLRERRGDILPLVRHFLGVYTRRMHLPLPLLGDSALRLLENYDWPGNIRELENVVHFALLVSGDREIRSEHLKVTGGWNSRVESGARNDAAADDGALALIEQGLRKLLEGPQGAHFDTVEKLVVGEAFRRSGNNQVHTASLLGISRNVVRTLLKRHGFLASLSEEDSDAA